MTFIKDKYIYDDGPTDAKIIFVGEAPGVDEYLEGKPFVGPSGQILTNCLNRNGLSRSDVRLANLFHYKIEKNKFESIINTTEFYEGVRELYSYIASHKPNVLVPLGGWPLKVLTGRKIITKWRGSIISYIHDENIKVIPTFHPAAVLRDGGYYPTFDQDIKRIVEDSKFPDKKLPVRRFIINPSGLELEEWTQRLCNAEFLGTDIETVKGSNKILCVGFAPSPSLAVCIALDSDEKRRAIQRILDSDADKIFQFGTFDTIQLLFLNGFSFNVGRKAKDFNCPYYWDTLVAQHCLAPELPRSLEYLTSIYTREPYYKTVGRGTIPDDEKGWSATVEKQGLYEYNCRDCCCTIEIALKQMEEMAREPQTNQDIFDFEMHLIDDLRDISCNGFLVDHERRQLIQDTLLSKWAKKQFVLNAITGVECNVRSPKLKDILYGKFGLPVRKNRDGGITTDEDAIVASITYCKDHIAKLRTNSAKLDWQLKLGVCQTILEIRGIRQVLANYILPKIGKKGLPRFSDDGRVRSTYRIGPETGRCSASKFVDGRGFNSQTLPRDPIEIVEENLTPASNSAILVATIEKEEPNEDEIEEESE